MKRIGWRVDYFLIDQKALNTVTYDQNTPTWLVTSPDFESLCNHSQIVSISDFENKDHFVLYFTDENKYSVPEHKTLIENVQVINTVSVKICGRKYTAKPMFFSASSVVNNTVFGTK